MLERMLLAVLALVSLSACSGKDGSSPVEPVEPKEEAVTYTFVVKFGEGVSGTPSEGSHTYKQGQSVEYSYKEVEGFHDAFVVLDSTGAALTGTLVMNSNKEVYASATKIPYVAPEDYRVAQAAEAVLKSSDKPVAFESYISEVKNLYQLYGREEAEKRARAISMNVFGSADFASVQGMQAGLDGKVFDFNKPEAVRDSRFSLAGSIDEGTIGIDLYYINGLFTPGEDAPTAVLELMEIIKQEGLPFYMPVRLLYNASAFRHMDEPIYCLITVGGACLAGGITDLTEAGLQLFSDITAFDLSAQAEAKEFAKIFAESREKDRAVILVGHSQGNLMIKEALRVLGAADPCIASISLANPSGRSGWNLERGKLSGFAVNGKVVGDFILSFGKNDFPRMETSLTLKADQAVSEAHLMREFIKFSQAWHLHYMLESYLGAPESRGAVGQMISKQALALAGKEECFKKKLSPSILAVSGPYNSRTSELWRVPPYETGVDTLLGQVHLKDGRKVELTDIARHPDGSLWGTSFYFLYKVDEASLVAEPQADWNGIHPNGLEFNPDGLLYVGTNDGTLALLDLGKLQYVWVSDLGEDYRSGGDIARCQDGKVFAIAEDRSDRNWLMEIGPEDGKVRRISDTAMEAHNIFGLSCLGERMFGLTSGESAGKSALVEIDMLTGKDRFVRELAFDAFGAAGDRVQGTRQAHP